MFVAILLYTALIPFGFILKRRLDDASGRTMPTRFFYSLFFFHLFLTIVYYLYAQATTSDSFQYYDTSSSHKGSWLDLYGTSTVFIRFMAYPLTNVLSMSYEAVNFIFSFLGFLGFLFFYYFFVENTLFKHKLWGFPLLTLLFFLPNLHFWSASLGKGSVIFLGIAMFFFGISRPNHRIIYLVLGGLLTYHVRPHILLLLLVGLLVGFTFSSRKVSFFTRFAVVVGSAAVALFIFSDVLALVGTERESFFSEGIDFSKRASDLSRATSGVDISGYSPPFLLFTFIYRPLFVDAPGVLGLIVSFENLFLLALTVSFLRKGGFRKLWNADFLVKSAIVGFLLAAFALAQVSGNLGLAIRQKSQVLMLFLFVILRMMDEDVLRQLRRRAAREKALGIATPDGS